MSKDWLNACKCTAPLDEHLARTLGRIGGESNSLALLVPLPPSCAWRGSLPFDARHLQ